MSMLLFVESMLWSIISESDFVVSSVVRSAQALLSFHMPTGKLGSRPGSLIVLVLGFYLYKSEHPVLKMCTDVTNHQIDTRLGFRGGGRACTH